MMKICYFILNVNYNSLTNKCLKNYMLYKFVQSCPFPESDTIDQIHRCNDAIDCEKGHNGSSIDARQWLICCAVMV